MPDLRPRMRAALPLAVMLLAGGSAVVAAAPRAVVETAPAPFIGAWELDLARMPDSYGPPPKRVTFTFEDLGSGEWRTVVEIIAPDDSVRRGEVRYRRDGRAVAGEGNLGEADRVAVESPAPNVLVMNMGKNGASAGVRVYAVSTDGREMTESAAGIGPQGDPFVRNFHFKRIR
jgi:hypothetical protein